MFAWCERCAFLRGVDECDVRGVVWVMLCIVWACWCLLFLVRTLVVGSGFSPCVRVVVRPGEWCFCCLICGCYRWRMLVRVCACGLWYLDSVRVLIWCRYCTDNVVICD